MTDDDDDKPNISIREFDVRMEEVRRAVDVARASGTNEVALRDYIERIIDEHQRALEIAERERSKAADALFAQQQRALEAALEAVSTAIARSDQQQQERIAAVAEQVKAGDAHLRQHIDQEFERIDSSLASARRESGIIHEASEKAIAKADAANEKRFQGLNGARETLETLASTMLPREVADAQISEIRKQVAAITTRIDQTSGRAAGVTSTVGYLIAAATLIISIVVVLANSAI